MSPAEETLIFLHIPKTGGNTLNSIIRRQYPPALVCRISGHPQLEAVLEFAERPEEERGRYRAIIGHVHLGMQDLVPGPSAVVTLLREPVERAISTYFFILEKPGHPLHEAIRDSGLDFAGVLRNRLVPVLHNGQTRALCSTELPVPQEPCTREMLEIAKRNVLERVEIAGTTERFDETLLLIKQRFGWRDVFYSMRNRGGRRPRREEVAPEVIRLIRECNQLDLELYEFVSNLLEARISALGASFPRRVKRFRRTNAAVQRLRSLRAHIVP